MSPLQWFQNSQENLDLEKRGRNYLDHMYYCARNTLSPIDASNTGIPCLGVFGGPAFTNLVRIIYILILGMYLVMFKTCFILISEAVLIYSR